MSYGDWLSLLVLPLFWYMWNMEKMLKEIVAGLHEVRKYAQKDHAETREFHLQQLKDHERMMEKHIEMYAKIQARWDTEQKK